MKTKRTGRIAHLIPAVQVPEVGRELQPGKFEDLVSQLERGEKLVGLFSRGEFRNAPWLGSDEELQVFRDQMKLGLIWCEGYFAVSEEEFYKLVEF